MLAAECSWMPLDRLIFFPDPFVPDPPPGIEERTITTADGLRLHAWWAGAPGATATLVWSHGNGGNVASRADVVLALAARGVAVPGGGGGGGPRRGRPAAAWARGRGGRGRERGARGAGAAGGRRGLRARGDGVAGRGCVGARAGSGHGGAMAGAVARLGATV